MQLLMGKKKKERDNDANVARSGIYNQGDAVDKEIVAKKGTPINKISWPVQKNFQGKT